VRPILSHGTCGERLAVLFVVAVPAFIDAIFLTDPSVRKHKVSALMVRTVRSALAAEKDRCNFIDSPFQSQKSYLNRGFRFQRMSISN
jgi:hypothetical protein